MQRDTYLNDVAIKNADGTTNYLVDGFDYRPGSIDQTYIPGFDGSAQETSVGVALTKNSPWSLVVNDLTQNAVVVTLSVQALSKTDSKTGDINGYEVKYQVQLQVDGGAWSAVVDTAFSGKASSAYSRSHRVNLTGATQAYGIRVVRLTDDTTDQYIQDKTSVVSYSLIVDAKLRYPLSALVGLSIDAVQFSSLPTRSYDLKGLLVNVPNNYDPVTRSYSGTWQGGFVKAWTDNPAWIFYDLVLNNRYGMGQYVDATMVDRYSLYQIARYCDVLVSDGQGGMEPRFTCNVYIQNREDAYKILQDLASIFRGMAYWAAGAVVAAADMPQDSSYLYTAANVVDGKFKYVGSSLKTRYTCAVVSWLDPNNSYKEALEYVEDPDGIARYGITKASITAFGCTSRGQAQRVGQWAMLTSRYETGLVTFSVGLDGTICQPGQIIAVADPARAAQRRGGRIPAATTTNSFALDKVDPAMAVGDTLTVIMPNAVPAKSTISNINGNVVTVAPPLPAVPVPGAVWISESAQVNAQLFRVNSVSEKDGLTFEISATQYEPGKFAAIDNGAVIDVRPITGNSFTTQVPPTGVTLTQFVVIDQGIAKTNLTIGWVPAPNAVSYRVQFQKDSGAWCDVGVTGQTAVDVSNIYAGKYLARVSATNAAGITSVYATSSLTSLNGKEGLPPTVATFTASTDKVFAIELDWTFPAGAGDTAYTEVYYSHTPDFSTATQLGRYSYPTQTTNLIGLTAGYDMYFWARLVDTTGNIGPWSPDSTAEGVHGMSSASATAILEYLTGQIEATQLAIELRTPIESIPAIAAKVDDTANAIAIETQNRIDEAAGFAQQISSLTVQRYFSPEAGDDNQYAGNISAYAGIWSEQDARVSSEEAISHRIDTVQAALDQIDLSTIMATIQTETTTRVTADEALASRIDTVQSSINTAKADLLATIQTETTARTTADAANASLITTVQATANSANSKSDANGNAITQNSASIQTNATAIATLSGNVSASYTVKLGVTANGIYYGAGFGVGINNNSGYITSAFYVRADTFAVLNTTGAATAFSPFVITGGQVFMNQAFIGTAYIDNARIADGAITYAKIGDAQIGGAKIINASIYAAHIANAQIINAHIVDAQITTAKIADAQITNAKIGNLQVDTLKIGYNSVSTIAAFGGNGTYYASGGTLVCMLFGTCGLSNGAAGTISANVNGSTMQIAAQYGPVNPAQCIVIGSPVGGIGVSLSQSGSAYGGVLVIMEYKR
jgi:predicted phage tail protein